MSLIGKEVSDFTVKAFVNGEFKDVSKKDLLGKWSVFVFYPADFTFICPTELEDLADHYEEFKKAGVEVYSVSTDTHFVHKAWHDASDTIKKIKFPMLADPTGKLSRDLMYTLRKKDLLHRGSFVINPSRKDCSL
jgi:alkyl hydroperoxide reductase subunit AhpC